MSVHKACDDLQDMLDSGILETGYLDMSTGRLILSDEGLQEEAPPAPEPDEPEPEEDVLDMNDDDAVLGEIRRLNDDIDDPVMSQKIDRIGEITGKIFAYQKQSPNRAGQLRSFLSYYLPTTLKILRAYARMEEQGVEGENIRSAKARIEGMMDKVVEASRSSLTSSSRTTPWISPPTCRCWSACWRGRPLRRRHDPGRLGEYAQEAPASGRGLLYAAFLE